MLAKIFTVASGFLLALVVAGALVLGTSALVNVGQEQVIACHQVNSLRIALVTVLQNGEKGLSANSYFKHHPSELAQAKLEYQQDLQKFQPVAC